MLGPVCAFALVSVDSWSEQDPRKLITWIMAIPAIMGSRSMTGSRESGSCRRCWIDGARCLQLPR